VGGAEPPITLEDLAALLVRVNGTGEYGLREFPEERRRIDIGDYYADDRLIRKTLGWRPEVALEEGLARTLAFYRDQLPHYL
jgi:UDP-glucose 4-epimerase